MHEVLSRIDDVGQLEEVLGNARKEGIVGDGEDWDTIHRGNIPLLYLDSHVITRPVLTTVRTHDMSSMYMYNEKSTGGSWSDDPDMKK